MRSLATFAATLLLATATPSLASFAIPNEDTASIFSNSIDTVSPSTSTYHFDERSGILTEYAPSSLTSDLRKRDTFSATFGLMLERDLASDPMGNRFQKRKHGDVTKRARDSGKREVIEVGFTKRGELVLPDKVLEKRAKSSGKKKKNSKKSSKKKGHVKNKKSPKMNKVTRSNNNKKKSTGNLQSSSSNGIQRSLVKLAASIPKISVSPSPLFVLFDI
jgi:hypothetical protein